MCLEMLGFLVSTWSPKCTFSIVTWIYFLKIPDDVGEKQASDFTKMYNTGEQNLMIKNLSSIWYRYLGQFLVLKTNIASVFQK